MRTTPLCLLACAALLPACDDAGGADDAVTVEFRVEAAGETVRCGQAYDGVGATGTTLSIKDLRLYVHDVRLTNAGGEAVPLELEQDGVWQHEDLALLDFEDKQGACSNGTSETRTFVRGTLPPGDYAGLSFKVGVPHALNHLDVATAPGPLGVTKMFWSWTAGYKFIRLDAATTGQPGGYNVHLGALECTGGGPAGPAVCALGNRPEITLDGFDPARDAVVLDLDALFAESDLDVNAPPASGCMSGGDDPDCAAVFGQLGLSVDGASAPPAQQAFRAGSR